MNDEINNKGNQRVGFEYPSTQTKEEIRNDRTYMANFPLDRVKDENQLLS